jgi:hypothetical protein
LEACLASAGQLSRNEAPLSTFAIFLWITSATIEVVGNSALAILAVAAVAAKKVLVGRQMPTNCLDMS